MRNQNNHQTGKFSDPTKGSQVKNPLNSNALTSQSQVKKNIIEITQDDQDYLTYLKNKYIEGKQFSIASNKDWKSRQPAGLGRQVYNLLEQLLQQNNKMKIQLDTIYRINYGQQTHWTFYNALCQYFRQLRQCNFKTANQILSTKLYDLPNLVSEFNILSDKLQQFQQSKFNKVQTQNSSFYQKLLNSIDNHQALNSYLLSSPQSKNLAPYIKDKLNKQVLRLKNQNNKISQNSFRWLKFFLSIMGNDFAQQKVQFMLITANQQIPASKQLTQTLRGIEKFCEFNRKLCNQNNKDSKISIQSNRTIQSIKLSQKQSESYANQSQFSMKMNNLKDYIKNQFLAIRNLSLSLKMNNVTVLQMNQLKFRQLRQKIISKIDKDFQFNQNLCIQQSLYKTSKLVATKFSRDQQKSSHTVQNSKLKLSQQEQKLKTTKSSVQIQNDQQLNNQLIKVFQSTITVLQLKKQFQSTLKHYQNTCNQLKSHESYRLTCLLQISNKNKQIQLLKKKQQQFDSLIHNKNSLIQSLQKKLQQNQGKIKRSQQLSPASSGKINQLQEQSKRNISSISNLKHEKQILQGEINKLRNELKEQRNKSIKYQESSKSQDALKQQIVSLRKDLELLEDVKATAQVEMNRKDQLIHEKNVERTKMQSQIVNLKSQTTTINNLNQQKLNQIINLKSQLQKQQNIISNHEKDKQNKNLINQNLNNKIHQLETELQKLKSQKKTPQFRSFNLNANQKRQTVTSVGKNNPVTKNIQQRSTTKLQTNLKSVIIENQKNGLIEEKKKTIQINAQTQSESKMMKKIQLQLFKQLINLAIPQQNIVKQISQKETQTEQKNIDEKQILQQIDLSNVAIQGQSAQFQQLKDQQLDRCKKCQQYELEIGELTKSNENLRNKNKNVLQSNSELQKEKKQKEENEKQLQQTKLQLQNIKIILKNNQSNERKDSLTNQKINKEIQQKCTIITKMEKIRKDLSNKVSQLENDKITPQKTIQKLKIQHQYTVKKYEQKNKIKPQTNQVKPKQQNASTQQLEALKKEFKMKVLTLELDLQEKTEHYDELYRKYKKQTTDLTNKIQTLTSATPGFQNEITTLKEELNKKQQTLNTKEKEAENLHNQIVELQKTIQKQKSDFNKFEQEVKQLKRENQSAEKQLSRLNKEKDTFESESYILKDKLRDQKKLNKQEIEKMKKDQAKELKDLRLQNARKLQEARRQIKSIQFAQKFKTVTDTNNESNAYMRLEFQKTKNDLQMELKRTQRLESEIKEMNNQIIQLKKVIQTKENQIKKSERKWQTMKQLMMLQI